MVRGQAEMLTPDHGADGTLRARHEPIQCSRIDSPFSDEHCFERLSWGGSDAIPAEQKGYSWNKFLRR